MPAGIRPREFRGGAFDRWDRAVRRAIERVIVMHHHHAVAGEMDVEFKTIGAEGQSIVERGKSVLWRQSPATAMGKHERAV